MTNAAPTMVISRLRARPGDTLVLQTERPLHQQQRDRLRAFLAGSLPPGVRILVIDIPAKLALVEDCAQLFSATDGDAVLQAAGDLIWHSVRKFGGNPSRVDYHTLDCGCTECT